MSPPLNFVFIDDSFHDITRISSLTAIVVPIAQYAAVRSDFYDLLLWATQPEPGVIGLAPELHGRNFLRDQPDALKIKVLSGICSLVRRHKLRIYRIGYFVTAELERR